MGDKSFCHFFYCVCKSYPTYYRCNTRLILVLGLIYFFHLDAIWTNLINFVIIMLRSFELWGSFYSTTLQNINVFNYFHFKKCIVTWCHLPPVSAGCTEYKPGLLTNHNSYFKLYNICSLNESTVFRKQWQSQDEKPLPQMHQSSIIIKHFYCMCL